MRRKSSWSFVKETDMFRLSVAMEALELNDMINYMEDSREQRLETK